MARSLERSHGKRLLREELGHERERQRYFTEVVTNRTT
jgi:hypothetical protein